MYTFLANFPATFALPLPPDWHRDDFKAISVVGDRLQETSKGRPVRGNLYWGREEDGWLHIAYLDLHWDQDEFAMVVTHKLGDDYSHGREMVPAPTTPESRPVAPAGRRMNFRKR